MTIEGHLRAMDVLQNQLAEKKNGSVALMQQLSQQERPTEQVAANQSRMERIIQENGNLRRELKLRGKELNQYKTKYRTTHG